MFVKIPLQDIKIFSGKIPGEFSTEDIFHEIWNIHPEHFNKIQMFEKEVYIPRWQQAYGKDYAFSKQVSKALPIPPELKPFLQWAKSLNPRFNGLLVNWYDSNLKHYIGKHRDSEVGLIENSPIITISLGSSRIFRMRHIKNKTKSDVVVSNGDVIIIPWATNKIATHEVPFSVNYPGKRISITIRAFKEDHKDD